MSEHLGPMTFGHPESGEVFLGRDLGRSRNYSEEVAAVIDKEIRTIVENAYDRACSILETHQEKLEEIATRLLRDKTVTGEEFRALFEEHTDAEQPEAEKMVEVEIESEIE